MTRFLIPHDHDVATDEGVESNSRLTASTGLVLTVLLLLEGFTILDVRGYITLHTVLGLMLIGPVALKCVTTGYRFVRYYRGDAPYVQRGAPPLVLRVIGPLVMLGSLLVIGTGLMLLIDHGDSDTWLTLHQASFIGWVGLLGLHFLGHIVEAVRSTARDVRAGATDPHTRRRTVRLSAVVLSLAVGVALAAAFTPAHSWWSFHDHHRDRHLAAQQ